MPSPRRTFRIGKVAVEPVLNSSTWRVVYFVDGKRVRRSLHTTNPMDARRQAEQINAEIATGTIPHARGSMTMTDAITHYLDYIRPRVAPGTYQRDRIPRLKMLDEFFGAKRLEKVSKEQIEQFFSSLYAKRYTAASVRSVHNTVRAFFSHYVRAGVLYRNPAAGLSRTLRKVDRAKIRHVEQDVLDKVLASCKKCDPQLYTVLLLSRYTGMRIMETLTRQWENVDWSRRTLHIGHVAAAEFTCKSHHERTVAVPDALLDSLAPFRRPSGWLCTWDKTQRFVSAPNNRLRQFIAACKLPKFTFHMLRHSFAAHWLQSGKSIYALSRYLGHSSVTITESAYGHFQTAKAAEIVNDLY